MEREQEVINLQDVQIETIIEEDEAQSNGGGKDG
jgi:hypothetical protein